MGLIRNIHQGLRFKNIRLLLEVVGQIRNWPLFFLDFLSIVPWKHITFNMRNGLKYVIRANTGDRGPVTIICLADEYKLKDLLLPDNSVVVDIGANIGIFSVCIAKKAGRILSYEPVPENFQILKENIRINNLEGKVSLFNYAVSDGKIPKLKIYLEKDNPGGHSIFSLGDKYVEAAVVTLKDIIDQNNIAKCELLKIDTEGSEYAILYALPDSYFSRIKRIYLEHHDRYFREELTKICPEYNRDCLSKFLKSKGYKIGFDLDCIFAHK